MSRVLALEEIAVFPIQGERFPDGRERVVPSIELADGFAMSIQASSGHHCTPQDDDGPWIEFEVCAPMSESMLDPYLSEEQDGNGIFTNVPIDVLRKIIDGHGGIVLNGQTYSYTTTLNVPLSKTLSAYLMRPSNQAFLAIQELLRSVNHLDKLCGEMKCHHCSYFKSALTGNESARVGKRAFCPFTAATHKSIMSVTDEKERAEVIGELLDLVQSPPQELSAELL